MCLTTLPHLPEIMWGLVNSSNKWAIINTHPFWKIVVLSSLWDFFPHHQCLRRHKTDVISITQSQYEILERYWKSWWILHQLEMYCCVQMHRCQVVCYSRVSSPTLSDTVKLWPFSSETHRLLTFMCLHILIKILENLI